MAQILIIDDSLDCLEEYRDAVEAFGYSCKTVSNGKEALQALNQDPEFTIVLTDLCMPEMDGLELLDEIEVRFSRKKPLACILITAERSIENAVEAMRHDAVDFLTKPVSSTQLAAALRRANSKVSRLESTLAVATSGNGALADAKKLGRKLPSAIADEELRVFVRNMMRSRDKRSEFMDPKLFADADWDILLELFVASLDGRAIPVTSSCAATNVPFTTAFRHVQGMVKKGLVKSWKDPSDKRRVLLELEDETAASMENYLKAIWGMQGFDAQ